jgi:ligand-binding sensor domain-containing protein
MRKWLLLIFILNAHYIVHSQNTIGIPNIVNYTKATYQAGSQTWNIVQDKKGIMYFANNDGLLSFDGSYWRIYPLPNKTIVRSVAISEDNKIYVGGQKEIGYFLPGKNGDLQYTSLNTLLNEEGRRFC